MKKVIYIISIVVLLLVINGLAHSIYDLWSKKDVITEAKNELNQQKMENQKLKGELSYVKTPQFIEEEARNKLFLTKPNEKVVIIPTASSSANHKKEVTKSNVQKWLDLFL